VSLYNAIFGVDVAAPAVLAALQIRPNQIPRVRDLWKKDGKLVIYTRTGGRNRAYFDSAESRKRESPEATDEELAGPYNDDLRALPGFLRDYDDEYDTTYALFEFEIPEWAKDLLAEVPDRERLPAERWKTMFEAVKNDTPSPDADRAVEVGRTLVDHITTAIKER
jgi:hypothetical protein